MELNGGVNLFRHRVRFGPYQARNAWVGVQSGSGRGPTMFNGQIERMAFKQKASFLLRMPSGEDYRGICRREQWTERQHYMGLFASGKDRVPPVVIGKGWRTWCTIERPSRASIAIEAQPGNSGVVTGVEPEIRFAQLAATGAPYAMWSGSTLGFLLDADGAPLASIELGTRPAVTLRRDLATATKDELAAVCMTLMVLSKLKD